MSKHAITKLKLLIAIPTYKRCDNVLTADLFEPEDCFLVVDTFELDDYKKNYPLNKIIEFKGSGLVGKRNAILDYAKANGYDFAVEIDDDFKTLAYFADGYTQRITDKKKIYQVIERMAVMARDAKTPLFTCGQTPDIRKYKRSIPFGLLCTQKIGFHGLDVNSNIRYDERFIVKHDIDMCLNVILNYRFFLIDYRYSFYYKPTMGTKGGLASMRNKDTETEMLKLLRNKWGNDIFSNANSERVSIYTLNIVNPFK